MTYDATNNPFGATISGYLALSATRTFSIGDSSNAANDLTVSAVVSGPAFGLTKTGAGTLKLSGANTYTGQTLIQGGTLSIDTLASLSSNSSHGAPTTAANVVLSAANSYNGPTMVQNSGTLKLGGSDLLPTSPQTPLTVNTSSVLDLASFSNGVASLSGDGTATVRNSVAGGTSMFTINPGSGISSTFAGVIAGTNGGAQGNIVLQKTGVGTLVLTGANTYSGATTVSGGTLTLASGSGSALGSTSGIAVNSGGTLLLGASNQINDMASIALGGGTFAKGNFSEGSTSTAGVGALTLSTTGSHLDFGTGTVGMLTFASFNPGGTTLTIDNWTGTAATAGTGTTDRLIFAFDQSANLGSFNFTGFGPGAMEFNLGGGYYEITPVPEPGTYLSGLMAFAAIIFHHRRQIRALFRRRGATK